MVLTEMPSTRTSDVIMKPLPSSTTRTGPEPSVTLLGAMEAIAGAISVPLGLIAIIVLFALILRRAADVDSGSRAEEALGRNDCLTGDSLTSATPSAPQHWTSRPPVAD